MTVALETIGVILYSKTGLEGPTGKRGFTRVCARLQGLDRTPLWSPQLAVKGVKYFGLDCKRSVYIYIVYEFKYLSQIAPMPYDVGG